jgi:hypothetical protein
VKRETSTDTFVFSSLPFQDNVSNQFTTDNSEIQPRHPVSNSVHAINLLTGDYEEIEAKGDEIPRARVGHTAAVFKGEIYVFGGVSTCADPGAGMSCLNGWSMDSLPEDRPCFRRPVYRGVGE